MSSDANQHVFTDHDNTLSSVVATIASSPTTLRPPVDPKHVKRTDDAVSTPGSIVYLRKDGKMVRRVKRRSSSTSSFDSNDDHSEASATTTTEIYIRADGKKVRRVKRQTNTKTPELVMAENSVLLAKLTDSTTVDNNVTESHAEPLMTTEPPDDPNTTEPPAPSVEESDQAPLVKLIQDEQPEPESMHEQSSPDYEASLAELNQEVQSDPEYPAHQDDYSSPNQEAPPLELNQEAQPDPEDSTQRYDQSTPDFLQRTISEAEDNSPLLSTPPKHTPRTTVDEPTLPKVENLPIIWNRNYDQPSVASAFSIDGNTQPLVADPSQDTSHSLQYFGTESRDVDPGLCSTISEPEPVVSYAPSTDESEPVGPPEPAEESEPEPSISYCFTDDSEPDLKLLSPQPYTPVLEAGAHSTDQEEPNPWLADPSFSADESDTTGNEKSIESLSTAHSPNKIENVAVEPLLTQSKPQIQVKAADTDGTIMAQPPSEKSEPRMTPADEEALNRANTANILQALSVSASDALEIADSKSNSTASAPPPLSPKELQSKPAHVATCETTTNTRRGYIPPQISTTLSGYSCTDDYSSTVDTYTEGPSDSWTRSPSVSPRRGMRVPEALAARTRSRMANFPAGNTSNSTMFIGYDPRTGTPMHRINEDDDAFILTTTMARKRVRVAQLLCFGLLGFSFGFLGSYFVQSSCHFVSADVTVGENIFELHYGMWKYTPLDSAYDGFAFCTSYDSEYTDDAPVIPRIAGFSAMILGSIALANLWVYLILGQASRRAWMLSIALCVVAGICQGLTFLFLNGHVCLRNTCQFGPGATMSLVSTVVWFVTAFEMHYNTPLSPLEGHIPGSGNLMSSLDVSDFGLACRAYCLRMFDKGDQASLPSLNQIQRNSSSPLGEGVLELSSARSAMIGSYKPPGQFV